MSAESAALRRAAGLAGRQGRAGLGIVLGAATVLAAVGLLATSGWLIVRAAEQPPVLTLTVAIVGVRFFALARAVLRYGERLATHDLAFRILADLRCRFYARLAPLVPAGLRVLGTGELLDRFVGDVDRLQDLYLRALSPPVVAAVVTAAAGALAIVILPVAGLVLVGGLLVGATVVPAATAWAARSAGRRQGAARGALAGELVEALGGAAELAVLGEAGARVARVRAADAELGRLARRDALAGGLASTLATFVSGATLVGVLALAASATVDGRISGPELGALALLALAAFEGVAPLGPAAQHLAGCAGAALRLEDVLDAPVPVLDPVAPRPVPGCDAALEARGVSLALGGRPVLDGVDLELAPGRAVALVGPSGCGKTTLAELLVRFRDPDAGTVTLGGTDVRELAQDDLRRHVLLVAQDAHVFNATIGDNLRLARRAATDEELLAALDAVGLGEVVRELPDGLGTRVGEDGEQLSGGQRRRLIVARGLVSSAPLLVFDEPAAHLDRPAAEALHRRLAAEARMTTPPTRGVLVIAHVLDGLDAFDEVVTLTGSEPTGSDHV